MLRIAPGSAPVGAPFAAVNAPVLNADAWGALWCWPGRPVGTRDWGVAEVMRRYVHVKRDNSDVLAAHDHQREPLPT